MEKHIATKLGSVALMCVLALAAMPARADDVKAMEGKVNLLKEEFEAIGDNPGGPENGMCHIPVVGFLANHNNSIELVMFKMDPVAVPAEGNIDSNRRINNDDITDRVAGSAKRFLEDQKEFLRREYAPNFVQTTSVFVDRKHRSSMRYASCLTSAQVVSYMNVIGKYRELAQKLDYAKKGVPDTYGYRVVDMPGRWWEAGEKYKPYVTGLVASIASAASAKVAQNTSSTTLVNNDSANAAAAKASAAAAKVAKKTSSIALTLVSNDSANAETAKASAAAESARIAKEKADKKKQQETEAAATKAYKESEAQKQALIEKMQKIRACVQTRTSTGDAYTEAEARSRIKLAAAGTTGKNWLGENYRVVSSNISCKKEDSKINPLYRCVGKEVTEVMHSGVCGSNKTSTGVSK